MRVQSRMAPNRASRAYRLGAVSALAIALALPQAAFAQAADDAGADDGSEIVVSGIRYSIANSINIKRNTDSIVEAVSAEEIGKLPDVSIADSIARLPGLAAQRVNGRAQSISLRGFSPDFTTTLLNGREQASSGDNRSVEFDQYPSELLQSVVVYKTPDADISGMGLAGSVDLRTVRPLAYGKRAFVVNVRGQVNGNKRLNSDVRNWGLRGSASWIGQNDEGTVGWAIGFAHLDTPSQNQHFKSYNLESFSGTFNGHGHVNTDIKTFINPDSADNAQFMSGQEAFAYSRENKRDAGMVIIEVKPSDKVHITLDSYFSKFNQREVMRGMQWYDNPFFNFFGPGGAAGTPDQTFTGVTTTTYGGTLIADTGTVNNVAPIVRNDYNTREDSLFSIGLNGEFEMTDKMRLIADLSYSSNTRDESITETYAGGFTGATPTANNTNYLPNRAFDTYSWDLHNLNGFPTYDFGLNYADAAHVSLGDRDPWGGWGHDGQTKDPHVKGTVFAMDLGLQRDLGGFIKSVDLGLNYTRTTKSKTVTEYDLKLKNSRAQVLVGSQYLVDPTELGFVGLGPVLSVNLPGAIPAYYDKTVFIDNQTFDKAWAIQEDVITGRLKFNIETGNLHGNVGVQWVHQSQSSSGSAINTTVTPRVVTPVNVSASYTDWLPSLNLTYELGNGHRLRLGLSRQMARPRMDQMRASFIPSFPRSPCTPSGSNPTPCAPGTTLINLWSGSGGNAKLEPWRAKSVDVAYEWYIDKSSYIAINSFYKHLDNYIYLQQQAFDFTGLPIPPTSLQSGTNANGIPPGVNVSPIGTIRQPANGKGGELWGTEISGAFGFGKLAPFLDGLGVIGSYAYTESRLHPNDSSNPLAVQATRIPGLSKHVYNVTGYYEKGGFQMRASYRWRSSFKGEVVQLFAVRGETEILPEGQLDAQISYAFPDSSALGGLSFQLQANNLTDSAYRTRLGTDGGGNRTTDGGYVPEVYEKYGREFLFGATYKF